VPAFGTAKVANKADVAQVLVLWFKSRGVISTDGRQAALACGRGIQAGGLVDLPTRYPTGPQALLDVEVRIPYDAGRPARCTLQKRPKVRAGGAETRGNTYRRIALTRVSMHGRRWNMDTHTSVEIVI